ncbi:MAG: hypothetical protein KA524_10915 [Nitrosomonas sp.]|nr:hypothetical protein [Nitrosomonas sp.]MBP6076894.1 hypothetical protein [Nitrosomonas sp.]
MNDLIRASLSADDKLIEAVRERAHAEQTTLNEQFRRWLADYVQQEQQTESAIALIEELRGQVRTGGRKFTRDEMNER